MNQKKILALGFFDGVHLGHQALLKACRELADELGIRAAAVTFDRHPMSITRGHAPLLINTPADREALLTNQGMDEIITLPFDGQLRGLPWQDFLGLLMDKYGAAGFVCGSDYRFGFGGEGSASLLREAAQQSGLPCVIVPQQSLDGTVISSSHIRDLLAAGRIEEATRFLGHPHRITARVVQGQGLGRTLGFPTANMAIPKTLVIPRHGVYACLVYVDGLVHHAVTNIGTRPTVNGTAVTMEPWLMEFSGDLYGKEITLEFYKFLRPERKFESLEALRTEIQRNSLQTFLYFEQHHIPTGVKFS